MLKINITQFNHYDIKTLYEFLFLQSETEFEITIPKKTVADTCDNYDVFEEYLSAAYAGQRLFEIAESFAYYVPCVHNKCPFLFEVTISDMAKMAETLHLVIYSINDKVLCETFLAYHSLAADFLTNASNNKANCNSWGLLHIAKHFLEKE